MGWSRLGREAPEGAVRGLRGAVVVQQPRAAAEAAAVRRAGNRVAPVKPKDSLQVPGAAVAQNHLVGVGEQLILTRKALVDAEAVGRCRSPAELGEPQRLPLVAV